MSIALLGLRLDGVEMLEPTRILESLSSTIHPPSLDTTSMKLAFRRYLKRLA